MSEIEYEPERRHILTDHVLAAQKALRIGIEFIDDELGRLTKGGDTDRLQRTYIETIKQEKAFCQEALENLTNPK